MASFSVDITEVRFAATNTGYKDITIIGRPQAIIGSITGTDASSFGWRTVDGNDSALRVYTTGNTTIGTNASAKTATFKITNAADSTDYVEVSLVQLSYPGKPIVRGVENVYDNVYVRYGGDGFGDADLFAEYRTDNVGTYGILYVDGYEGTTTLSQSWAYYTADSAYTDTGFKRIMIGASNNYDTTFRYCNITFPGTGGTHNYSRLYQNAYPSSTSGCTSPTLYTKDGGTERVTLCHSSQNVSNLSARTYYTSDGLTYSITKTAASDYKTYWDVTIGPNANDKVLRGALLFERSATHELFGFTIVRQDAASGPTQTLTVDPSVLTYPSSGGARVLDVTYATSLSTNESSMPSWLSATYVSVGNSERSYTITAASNNTSVARDWDLELADVNMSLVVPITQAAGQASSLSISPSSNSVTNSSGSVQITVTAVGISEINYSSTSWITYSSKSGDVYTFSYTANATTSQRTGTITFYGGGLSETYTLIQAAGDAPSLVVSPTSDSVGASSGTYQVTVTPTNISSVTYSISDNWLSYSSKSGNVYTFSYTANATTSQRQSVVTFTGDGISRTFTLTQAAGSSAPITADVEVLGIGSGGAYGTIHITYNGSYTVSKSSWISGNSSGSSSGTSNYTYSIGSHSGDSDLLREGYITFTGSNGSSYTIQVFQGGKVYQKVPQVIPKPIVFPVEGGDVYVAVDYYDHLTYTNFPGLWVTKTIVTGSENGDHPVIYRMTTGANTGSERSKTMTFQGGDSLTLRTTNVTLTQAGGATPTSISISPSSGSVGSSSGVVSITATGANNIQYYITESWVHHSSTSGSTYTFGYDTNSGSSSRTANIVFSASGATSATYTLTQAAGSTAPVITVSPTSSSVGSSSGTTSVSATATGGITVNYSISGSWLSYVGVNNGVYTFSYTANTGSSSRTATVTFSGTGATSKTFTLTQAGTSPGPTPVETKTLQAHPSSLRFYKESSSKAVSFTNRPTAGISYSITYTDGSGWLSVSGSGKSKTVTVAENTGIRRRATIRFYETGNSSNYVDVPVIQGSADGYDSIWMDQLFYPQDRDADNNYFYRVANVGYADLFVGVSTIPPGWGGNVGGIDIPRLVEGSITSYLMTNPGFYSGDWADMYESYCTTEVYNMTQNGYPGTLDATFKYWNDWSRTERRYDYTRTLNDPINGKGREDMFMPFCIYYDDAATFSIVETETNGNVNTYTFSTPAAPFVMRYDRFYDTKKLVYKQDNQVLFTYDMTHCGPGAFIYRNRYGGWDSFLIEGNVSMTDNYSKLNFRTKGDYNGGYVLNTYGYFVDEKHTEDVNINQTFEAHTGWLSDEESERLAFHLLSSPRVYFQDFNKVDDKYDTDPKIGLVPVRLTNSSVEYKKFRNGKRLVNYTITFEKCSTEKVKF